MSGTSLRGWFEDQLPNTSSVSINSCHKFVVPAYDHVYGHGRQSLLRGAARQTENDLHLLGTEKYVSHVIRAGLEQRISPNKACAN